MNKGFTLIELLVVVLIIGILAAIALPQYQKAVERSRMAEAIQVLGDLATAQHIYFMQNSVFADGWEDIAQGDMVVTEPAQGAYEYTMNGGDVGAIMFARRNSGMYGPNSAHRGVLQLSIEADGTIHKICFGMTDFCAMAQTAGYTHEEDPIIW